MMGFDAKANTVPLHCGIAYWSIATTAVRVAGTACLTGRQAGQSALASLRWRHLRLVVCSGVLLGLIAFGPRLASAADDAVQATPAAPAVPVAPSKAPQAPVKSAPLMSTEGASQAAAQPAATDMISLEVDAKVAKSSIRREVDPATAAKLAKSERKSVTLTGVIVAKGLGGISFSPGTTPTSTEFWLPFEPGLKLMGYGKLADIHDGDLVNVTYEERLMDHDLFLKKIALLRTTPVSAP